MLGVDVHRVEPKGAPGRHPEDSLLGIPLPAAPTTEPSLQIRFTPNGLPAPSPLHSQLAAFIAASPLLTASQRAQGDDSTPNAAIAPARNPVPVASASADLRPRGQDAPSLLRCELEAFIAASPLLASATAGPVQSDSTRPSAVSTGSSVATAWRKQLPTAALQTVQAVAAQEGSALISPRQPHVREQEAARLACRKAAKAAAREASLASKRRMVREQLEVEAASKKSKRGAVSGITD